METKLIEGYEPKEDTNEALDTLINDFIAGYEDDKN